MSKELADQIALKKKQAELIKLELEIASLEKEQKRKFIEEAEIVDTTETEEGEG